MMTADSNSNNRQKHQVRRRYSAEELAIAAGLTAVEQAAIFRHYGWVAATPVEKKRFISALAFLRQPA